jgi:hypothetical protein
MGSKFWVNLIKKLADYELHKAKVKQDETLRLELEKINREKVLEKKANLKMMASRFNQALAKGDEKRLTKEKCKRRMKGRRNSDNLLFYSKSTKVQDLEDPRLVKPKSQTYLRSDLLEMEKKEHRGSVSMSRMSSFRSQNSNADFLRKVSITTGQQNLGGLPRIAGQNP